MKSAELNQTVLLVEDSDDDAFFFERAFTDSAVAARLIRVHDGGSALDYLRGASEKSRDLSRTHVVFLDLKIPVFSGLDVLRWIKERDLSVKVLVLSGSDLDSDVEMARALGAADYIVKPISPADLKKCLTPEAVLR